MLPWQLRTFKRISATSDLDAATQPEIVAAVLLVHTRTRLRVAVQQPREQFVAHQGRPAKVAPESSQIFRHAPTVSVRVVHTADQPFLW